MSKLWLRSQCLFLATLLAAVLLSVPSGGDLASAANEQRRRRRKHLNANANSDELSPWRSSSLVVHEIVRFEVDIMCGYRSELASALEGAFLDYFDGRCSDVADDYSYDGNYYENRGIELTSLILDDWKESEECSQFRELDDNNRRRKVPSGGGDPCLKCASGYFATTGSQSARRLGDEKNYSQSDIEPHHSGHNQLDKSNFGTKKRELGSTSISWKEERSSYGYYRRGPKYKGTMRRRLYGHPPVYPDPYLAYNYDRRHPHHSYHPPSTNYWNHWYNPHGHYWNYWYYPPAPPPGHYHSPPPPIPPDPPFDRGGSGGPYNDPALICTLISWGFSNVYFARITDIREANCNLNSNDCTTAGACCGAFCCACTYPSESLCKAEEYCVEVSSPFEEYFCYDFYLDEYGDTGDFICQQDPQAAKECRITDNPRDERLRQGRRKRNRHRQHNG